MENISAVFGMKVAKDFLMELIIIQALPIRINIVYINVYKLGFRTLVCNLGKL